MDSLEAKQMSARRLISSVKGNGPHSKRKKKQQAPHIITFKPKQQQDQLQGGFSLSSFFTQWTKIWVRLLLLGHNFKGASQWDLCQIFEHLSFMWRIVCRSVCQRWRLLLAMMSTKCTQFVVHEVIEGAIWRWCSGREAKAVPWDKRICEMRNCCSKRPFGDYWSIGPSIEINQKKKREQRKLKKK